MNKLFESLEKHGFLKKGKPDESKIGHASISDIIDCAEESVELTSAEGLKRENSLFAFSSSIELSGGRFPCASLVCRSQRVNEISRFAALYADRIYVKNLFTDFLTGSKPHGNIKQSAFKQDFKDDLTILCTLRPLIEKQMVIPITPPTNYCPHCLAKMKFGKDADRRLKKEVNRLLKCFLYEVEAELVKKGPFYLLISKGPELLVEHGGGVIAYWQLPPSLLRMTDAMKRLDAGKSVSLSHSMRNKMGLHKLLASKVLQNVLFDLSTSQCIGTTFITNKELHVQILNSLSDNPLLQRRNYLAERHLTSLVPILGDLNLEEVIKFREQEAEAFIIYRQALREAIDEYRENRQNLTPNDAKSMYGDIIAPKLAKLERTIKLAKRNLLKDTGRKLKSWVGVITFGVFTGLLPAQLAVLASSLGLAQIAAGFLEAMMKKNDVESLIEGDSMYFLWKVKEMAKN